MRDRLSDLPDELRLQILALLPSTRLQASTSVLSKRWLDLWTLSPNLAFYLHDFSAAPWVDPTHTKAYPLIVDHCLELSVAPAINSLSFDIPPCHDPAIDRWLDFAASRSAREVSLRFFSPLYSPPWSLFRCRSLAALRLEGCSLKLPVFSSPFDSDPFRGFPSLKSLSLTRVVLASYTLHALLSSSPFLETLVLNDCCASKVVVELPHLRSIFYRGPLPSLSMVPSPHLRRACILGGDGPQGFETHWKKTLSAVSHTEILVIDNWVYQDDEGSCVRQGRPAMFQNLKELHFRVTPQGTVLSVLGSVLEECPTLEKLCIEFEGAREDRPPEVYKEVESLSHPLKIIRFFNVGDDSEYAMSSLAFLLGNTVALETLEIHPCPDASAERLSELKELVSRLPRASPQANVVVREHSVSSDDVKPCCMKMWEDEVKF